MTRTVFFRATLLKAPTLAVAASAFAGAALAQSTARLPLFEAEYTVEYEGKDSGEAVFSLTYDAGSDTYTYTSETKLKGLLLRAVLPRPIIDRSVFRYDGSTIVPLTFRHEDGSRKGEENQEVVFDWSSNLAELSSEKGQRQLTIDAGTLDRASAQIALMRTLQAGEQPAGVTAADGESIESYSYSISGPQMLDTKIGNVPVIVVTQQREGSSRKNVLRLSTEHDYLPVSIEQHRGDELRFAWRIESLRL